AVRVEGVGQGLQLLPGEGTLAGARVRHVGAVLTFAPSQEDAGKAAAVSCQFVLAQFRSSAGTRQWLARGDVDDDASLQVLAGLFAHADRDGNGKLTLAELEQFLSLIEQGVRCPLLLTLTDGGRNLFDLLDANGDGRLD